MTQWIPFLLFFARLFYQLSRNDPAAYAELGKPVMRWLWWRWPASAPGSGPRLFLQARGRLDVSCMRWMRWAQSPGLPSGLFSIARISR
jgi:hypothetical protein